MSIDKEANKKNNKKMATIMILLFFVMIVIGAVLISQQFQKSPNQPLLLYDSENDFILVDYIEEEIEDSIDPVDITKVEAKNDGKNFLITVTTKESLPVVGSAYPPYPNCYGCEIFIVSDKDGSRLFDATIIIDTLYGWQFISYEEEVTYNVNGNELTFIFPLDMTDWVGESDVIHFQVRFCYEWFNDENDFGRLVDLLPNQKWSESKYQDYALWKD